MNKIASLFQALFGVGYETIKFSICSSRISRYNEVYFLVLERQTLCGVRYSFLVYVGVVFQLFLGNIDGDNCCIGVCVLVFSEAARFPAPNVDDDLITSGVHILCSNFFVQALYTCPCLWQIRFERSTEHPVYREEPVKHISPGLAPL